MPQETPDRWRAISLTARSRPTATYPANCSDSPPTILADPAWRCDDRGRPCRRPERRCPRQSRAADRHVRRTGGAHPFRDRLTFLKKRWMSSVFDEVEGRFFDVGAVVVSAWARQVAARVTACGRG